MESDLVALLETLCPDGVFPDEADLDTPRPYVVWQLIGGPSLRYVENTPANKRMSYVQLSVWCDTRAESLTLIRSIEDALCASTAFEAKPNAEPIGDHDPVLNTYGVTQDFTVFANR
jgi:hypothetical protein